jgi:hypothetical protein
MGIGDIFAFAAFPLCIDGLSMGTIQCFGCLWALATIRSNKRLANENIVGIDRQRIPE